MPIGYTEQQHEFSKAAITSVSGVPYSLWRATGFPTQPAIPVGLVSCTSATPGGVFLRTVASGVSYLADMTVRNSVAAQLHVFLDRLAHNGNFSGTLTTAQTVNLDASTLTVNAARKGAADWSELMWYLEWYTATGSTAVTATVSVVYSDGTTGNLSPIALAATRPIGFLVSLNSYIPSAKSSLYIRAVNTVTLSASTGVAGAFGVTLAKRVVTVSTSLATYASHITYEAAAMPDLPNGTCLWCIVIPGSTSTGIVQANFRSISTS